MDYIDPIDWDASIIDLRDVIKVREQLEEQRAATLRCLHCGDDLIKSGTMLLHADTHLRVCDEEDPDAALAEPVDNELDEEQVEQLTDIAELAEALGDLQRYADNSPTMVNEHYWVEFVEEDATELMGIPDSLVQYVDFERLADDWAVDWTEHAVAGRTFLIRDL